MPQQLLHHFEFCPDTSVEYVCHPNRFSIPRRCATGRIYLRKIAWPQNRLPATVSSASEIVKRVSDETPNASAAAWMYLAHPSFELPCWHCFQRADIAFNLISNLIFGDFQVIARLEIHPERRTIVEVARET